jgi:hypothetical protein
VDFVKNYPSHIEQMFKERDTMIQSDVDRLASWYHAQDGDIWKLSSKNMTARHYVVFGDGFFLIPLIDTDEQVWAPARFSHEFDAGKLIWSAGETQ